MELCKHLLMKCSGGKKAQKIPVILVRGPSTKTIVLRTGQDVGLVLLQGGQRVEAKHLLKGQSENFKMWWRSLI
jgi:hypothetical protein